MTRGPILCSVAADRPAEAAAFVRWWRAGAPAGGWGEAGDPDDPLVAARRRLARWVSAAPQRLRLDRLRVGSEFCERRIPTVRQVETAAAAAERLGVGLEYVTGPVTDPGLRSHLDRIGRLAAVGPVEVAVNDWGLVGVLGAAVPAAIPVLGRLLVKQVRSPRLEGGAPVPVGVSGGRRLWERQREAYRTPEPFEPGFARWLAGWGVRDIEVDAVGWGVRRPPGVRGPGMRLHLPWACATTGRCCPTAALRLPGAATAGRTGPCGRLCRDLHTSEPVRGGPPLVQRGNTVFLDRSRDLDLHAAGGPWTRLVLHLAP